MASTKHKHRVSAALQKLSVDMDAPPIHDDSKITLPLTPDEDDAPVPKSQSKQRPTSTLLDSILTVLLPWKKDSHADYGPKVQVLRYEIPFSALEEGFDAVVQILPEEIPGEVYRERLNPSATGMTFVVVIRPREHPRPFDREWYANAIVQWHQKQRK